jgi:hypothetical protein
MSASRANRRAIAATPVPSAEFRALAGRLEGLKAQLDGLDTGLGELSSRFPVSEPQRADHVLAINIMRAIASRSRDDTAEHIIAAILRQVVQEIAGAPAPEGQS